MKNVSPGCDFAGIVNVTSTTVPSVASPVSKKFPNSTSITSAGYPGPASESAVITEGNSRPTRLKSVGPPVSNGAAHA